MPAIEAGTNRGDPQASSSTPAGHGEASLFSDGEDLSDPDGEREDGEEKSADDIVVDPSSRLHATTKRPRAVSLSPEPPADAPQKRHHRARSAVKKKAATSKPASHSPRPAPSTKHSKKNKADGSDVDMEIDFDDNAESGAENQVMRGDGDEEDEDVELEGHVEKTFVGVEVGKGKMMNKNAPSSNGQEGQ